MINSRTLVTTEDKVVVENHLRDAGYDVFKSVYYDNIDFFMKINGNMNTVQVRKVERSIDIPTDTSVERDVDYYCLYDTTDGSISIVRNMNANREAC